MIGALALTVAGCSHSAPQQSAAPCVNLNGTACAPEPPAGQLAGVEQGTQHRSAAARHAPSSNRRVARHRPAVHRTIKPKVAHASPAAEVAKPISAATAAPAPQVAVQPSQPAQPQPAQPQPAQPQSAQPQPAQPRQSGSGEARAAGIASPDKVQEQVTVATALAERMTAIASATASAQADDKTKGRLVAVLLAGPTVKAVSELRGKVIAIDDRYVASNGRITTAIAAAGAPEVLVLEGQSTAISRLTSGEVAAAVVALVTPEVAEAFPKIAGLTLFEVPLPTR
ncbi:MULTISPECIES: hypothetical protein [unclassified Bradyrhizobium]|uniref:hypothetical protein n=1 Tax=unclassified Bradyrhizobium TaxID=2631580 RepID=UPI002916FE5F|nr:MULTISPECIES: hypothetical protein [unclassified Bradyrhizobium]